MGCEVRKPVSNENNQGADQPAHPSLISAFVIHLLESINEWNFNLLASLCS